MEVVPVYLTNVSTLDALAFTALLREHNIPVLSKAPGSGGLLEIVGGSSFYGDDLYVNERDWEKAHQLLEEYRQTRQPPEQKAEATDAQADPFGKRRKIFRVFLWVVLGMLGLQVLYALFSSLVSLF